MIKNQLDETPYSRYIFQTNIGQGEQGEVVLISSSLINGDYGVMKKIKIKDEKTLFQLTQEGNILEKLNHPNIIKYYDMFRTRDKYLCIVTVYAERGDISKLMKKLQINVLDEDSLHFIAF